ncbi:hypothetical protein QTN47_17015 [Danxiaibacter flavus]|uniref:Uncharacterized protein n=1 Tax=Danxiaibacter flavus TaxID=3049108 RepID=A0ABV3ZHA2_9BACT|nr:hypothetical protein QNM32_17025 [Chitinophagaceae bacterium DXS]
MAFGLLKKLFKPKQNFPNSKHIIEYAFTCGGIDYYQFQDIFNLPYHRGLQALVYYREVSLNISAEDLIKHTEAVRESLSVNAKAGTIDIHKAFLLNEQLAVRAKLPPDTDLLYKLASVVYFDKNEKPETYEFNYGAKKIEHWKKHSDVKDFFLQTPIQELLPFLKEYGENINSYQAILEQAKTEHSANMSGNLLLKRKKVSNGKLK